MLQALRADPLTRMLGHTTVVLALLTLAFYLVPFRFDRSGWTWGRLAVSLLALALVGLLIRGAFRRSRRTQPTAYQRIQALLTVLYGLVLGFALAYAVLETVDHAQFVGIKNRTDALYFSVTLVSTAGFGDIHAAATTARLLATAHMLFNLIYLGTALRVLTGSRQWLQPGPPDADPEP